MLILKHRWLIIFSVITLLNFTNAYSESAALRWQSTHITEGKAKSLFAVLSGTLNQYMPSKRAMIGVSAVNLKTGQHFSINGDQHFFMASTYKIAIAVQLLTLVDQGKLSLSKMVHVTQNDIRPGSGLLVNNFNYAGLDISVINLMALMLQRSDNTATDLLLALAGGPQAVTARLRALGVNTMRVDRSTLQFTFDYFGIKPPPKDTLLMPYITKEIQKVPTDFLKQALVTFLNDPRDTTTPDDMVKLLSLIYEGKSLQKKTTDILLNLMSKKDSEVGRLYFYLPKNTWIAEKLGTGEGVANDVGIIALPNGQGPLVVAVYSKFISSDDFVNDKAAAYIARTLYDFFIFI